MISFLILNKFSLIISVFFIYASSNFLKNFQYFLKNWKFNNITAYSENWKDFRNFFVNKFKIIYKQQKESLTKSIFQTSGGGNNVDVQQSTLPILEKKNFELEEEVLIRFNDIAGNEEAKEELKEIVKFLRDPNDFIKLGATIPKGVLLSGPPGTGKTMLAKAVAGESETPFFKVSGSEFVELLVGVGASRVRDLFEQARAKKPSIIFIDEIDSVAKKRASGLNANDEREQTLNQLLTEMDGFQVNEEIVVIGSTNRIDILDPAILRSGRFDRQITLTNPTTKEREAILNVHLKKRKFDPSISTKQIALRTSGFSGADLANLVNEAAILAVRKKKKMITKEEFDNSLERILLGIKKIANYKRVGRKIEAFSKISNSLIAFLFEERENIEKISLIPRGSNNSSTLYIPSPIIKELKSDFLKNIMIFLSGRGIEDIFGGETEFTTSEQNSILQYTRILRSVILRYAMLKLQEMKEEIQKKNLDLVGTDIQMELANFVDIFTINFFLLLYEEILFFLQLSRPLIEKIADELIILEELEGNDIRTLILEYFERGKTNDIFSITQDSSFFTILWKKTKNLIDSTHSD